jgi:hypothetical protein
MFTLYVSNTDNYIISYEGRHLWTSLANLKFWAKDLLEGGHADNSSARDAITHELLTFATLAEIPDLPNRYPELFI